MIQEKLQLQTQDSSKPSPGCGFIAQAVHQLIKGNTINSLHFSWGPEPLFDNGALGYAIASRFHHSRDVECQAVLSIEKYDGGGDGIGRQMLTIYATDRSSILTDEP